MIQAKLEHPTETGVSVMVTWIPIDLRTKQGDRITAGKDPADTENVYGGTPPVATALDEYAVPEVPVAVGQVIVRVGGAVTVMLQPDVVAVLPFASVTFTE